MEGYEPYITPTIEAVRVVIEAGADIVAIDATHRPHPNGLTTEDLIKRIRPIAMLDRDFPAIVYAFKISMDRWST